MGQALGQSMLAHRSHPGHDRDRQRDPGSCPHNDVGAQSIGATFRVDVERRIDGAASVGAHRTSMLQDVDKGRPIELDALLTSVQEMGRLAGIATPFIDNVLALAQQMGRVRGLYPTFPEPRPSIHRLAS